MKNIILSTALIIAPGILSAEAVALKVDGMVCAFCAQGLEKKFSAVKGLKDLEIKLENKTIRFNLDDGAALNDKKIEEIIKDAGFKLKELKRT